jgi:radical SAM superfamily enzyme YgiQ (UPF0313 family)
MNVLLINPEWPDTYWSFRHALPFQGKRCAYPPLGLLTVASMLPSHWNRRLADMNVRRLADRDLQWADVVMITGMLVHKPGIEATLRRCRAAKKKSVVGGPVASSSLEELQDLADHIVVGEAEDLMPEVVADLENGNAKPVYRSSALPDMSRAPGPDLSLIQMKHYSAMSVQFSRGCPFNCEFCDIIEIYGRRPRTKTPEQIVAELEDLYRRNWRGSVFLVDDNFIGNKKKVKELLPVLAEWNRTHGQPFNFFTEASLNLADDLELLRMMREASFTRVFLGIETPVEDSLKEAQKLQNTRRSLLESVRRIQSFGVEVMAGFIVGFDSDPEDIFERQVQFIKESAIPMAMVGLLQALPNTQLYRRLAKEGRLLHDGMGDNTEASLNFVPHMDAGQLLDGYRYILAHIYEPKAYYERVRQFLAQYHPRSGSRHRSLADYKAFFRSLARQGILEKERFAYWKFLFDAATRYRHAFGTAVTLAIMGYHFQKITQRVCETKS